MYFTLLKIKKYNVICLQDVHISNKMEDFVKNEWGYNAYFSSYSTSSEGVMTLINNNFEQKVEQVRADKNGNYLLISIIMHEKKPKKHWLMFMDLTKIIPSFIQICSVK